MEALRTEVIKHMLEAADAQRFSALLSRPDQWTKFNAWCGESPEASRVVDRASEKMDTVCLDNQTNLYCVAMSMNTLESIVKDLVESYEDEELSRFFS